MSYESKSESSSSFEINSSGTVTTSSSYKETKSESTGDFTFKVNDVNLLKGKTEFNLSITNNSDKDTTLQSMTLSFKATDENNKPIQDGSTKYEKMDLNNIYDLPHTGSITEKSEPLLTIIDKDKNFDKLYKKVEYTSEKVNQIAIKSQQGTK